MAECSFCKEETQLHYSGVPVCVKCSQARDNKGKPETSRHQVLNVLHEDLRAATERVTAATAVFNAITTEIPSGIPHPDGTQRIHNASREMAQARVALMNAHNRLNDYLARGIVPEDLKQRSGS